jgi:hypothetical protein
VPKKNIGFKRATTDVSKEVDNESPEKRKTNALRDSLALRCHKYLIRTPKENKNEKERVSRHRTAEENSDSL